MFNHISTPSAQLFKFLHISYNYYPYTQYYTTICIVTVMYSLAIFMSPLFSFSIYLSILLQNIHIYYSNDYIISI